MTHPAIDEAKVAEAAYLMWLDEGRPHGRDAAHWLAAIDALTPPTPKPARKAPAKPRAAKAKTAAAGAAPAAKTSKPAAKKPRAAKAKPAGPAA